MMRALLALLVAAALALSACGSSTDTNSMVTQSRLEVVGDGGDVSTWTVPPELGPASVGQALALGDDNDRRTYRVVVNEEEQYSIWPADRDMPLGWRDAGVTGTKTECLAYINQVWLESRPQPLAPS